MKTFVVFEYVYDAGKGEYTPYEGYIMGFVEADDAYEACEKLGYTDNSRYFANVVHDQQLEKYKEAVEKQKKELTKAGKQLGEIIKSKTEEAKKLEGICPNCGEHSLDENGNCTKCSYGHELENFLKKVKEEEKKAKKTKKASK